MEENLKLFAILSIYIIYTLLVVFMAALTIVGDLGPFKAFTNEIVVLQVFTAIFVFIWICITFIIK